MRRYFVLAYGLASYALAFGVFLYLIGFVENLIVPKGIDTGPAGPAGTALLVDFLLLSQFAIQHSGMARQSFKRRWTGIIPAEIERSTYVLAAGLSLALLCWQWRPITSELWAVENTAASLALRVVAASGWVTVFFSSMLISHVDMFGLRQVWLYWLGQDYTPLRFQTPLLYRTVRHPIYLGFLIAFWAAPTMTAGRLLFALAGTGYIFVGILFEERDLMQEHGDSYRRYRLQVPMIVPLFTRKPRNEQNLP